MSRGGVVVDRVVACPGIGSGQAAEALIALVGAGTSYHAVRVGADRVQFARTFRPTWATVLGWCLLPVALIGVFFFLVKTTETCVAVVEADHRGTRIRLSGRLDAQVLEQLLATFDDPAGAARDAAAATAVGAPVEVANSASPQWTAGQPPVQALLAPPPPAPHISERSNLLHPGSVYSPVANADASSTIIAPSRRGGTTPKLRAVLDDGSELDLSTVVLLGRDPTPGSGESNAALVPVADPERSVSKTHLKVEVLGGVVLATDRNSTNGSSIVASDGTETVLEAGVPTEVPPGSAVRFGARTMRVSSGSIPGGSL